jgi:plastocyanin
MRITLDSNGAGISAHWSLNMQRFRLLTYYLVGIVAVVGLAVWGVSMRRVSADARTLQATAGGAVGSSTARTDAASSAVVSIDNFSFDPKELMITAGTTVTWVNADDLPHTATSTASPPLFDSKTLDKDDKFSFQFNTPGTYEFFCKLHPTMTGKVIVNDARN